MIRVFPSSCIYMSDYLFGNMTIRPGTLFWSEDRSSSEATGIEPEAIFPRHQSKHGNFSCMTLQLKEAGQVLLRVDSEDGSSMTLKHLFISRRLKKVD